MRSWFNDMVPRFKNWRWWLVLPIVLIGLSICLIFWIGESMCDFSYRLLERINPAHKSNGIFSKVIEWSEANDKTRR